MYTETEEEENEQGTNPSESSSGPLSRWHSALDSSGCITGLLVAQLGLCTGFASREGSASPRCRRRHLRQDRARPDRWDGRCGWHQPKLPDSHCDLLAVCYGHRERWSVGGLPCGHRQTPVTSRWGVEASGSFTPPPSLLITRIA